MANAYVAASLNDSKHQMRVVVASNGTPLPAVSDSEMVVLLKDTVANYPQVTMLEDILEAANFGRSVLADIENIGQTYGHVIIARTSTGEEALTPTTGGDIWADTLTDTVSLAIPTKALWAENGSTVALTGMVRRMLEVIREDVLVKI